MEEAILVEVPCYIDDQDQAETDTINVCLFNIISFIF